MNADILKVPTEEGHVLSAKMHLIDQLLIDAQCTSIDWCTINEADICTSAAKLIDELFIDAQCAKMEAQLMKQVYFQMYLQLSYS